MASDARAALAALSVVATLTLLVSGPYAIAQQPRAGEAAHAAPAAADATPASATDGEIVVDSMQRLRERALLVPVAGVARASLRDTFDQPRGKGRHEAIDIMAARGTPVIAADDGRVAKLFESLPGGHTIYVFDTDANFAYYYAHLDRYAEGLKEGLAIRRGDVLGYVGTSGDAPPNAPHLHFAIFRLGPEKRWWKGTPIDPYPLLQNAAP